MNDPDGSAELRHEVDFDRLYRINDPLGTQASRGSLLLGAGVSGWSPFSVQVFNKTGAWVAGYGRSASRDLSRSEITLQELPGGWRPLCRGHYSDEASWDGSDLFMEHARIPGRGAHIPEHVAEDLPK